MPTYSTTELSFSRKSITRVIKHSENTNFACYLDLCAWPVAQALASKEQDQKYIFAVARYMIPFLLAHGTVTTRGTMFRQYQKMIRVDDKVTLTVPGLPLPYTVNIKIKS